MRSDDTTVLDPSGPGRNSVRIKSVKNYTTHVTVYADILMSCKDWLSNPVNSYDIVHMPAGCGTFPAVWESAEANWPAMGEIDIVSD